MKLRDLLQRWAKYWSDRLKGETDESIAIHEKKLLPTIIGIVFVVLIACFLFFSNSGFFFSWMNIIEDKAYDLQVRSIVKPLGKNPMVAIVAIDDRSIEIEGRLPWSRKKMGQLVANLKELGAKWVALDFMFPQSEKNVAEEVIQELKRTNHPIPPELQNTLTDFDYDASFAKSLEEQPSILGMFFNQGSHSVGFLPSPLLEISENLSHVYLPHMTGYLGNIEILQKAAKFAGFINATPDSDGIIRFAPLIYQHSSNLYGSLSLIAAYQFLNVQNFQLISKPYENLYFLENLALDQRLIPVDPYGRILIPFRGPASTFPKISATDVLNKSANQDKIKDKLVFVGTTATASGEYFPVAASPSYPAIEIHATIAQGIIDNYLPFKPTWGKGISVALILILGLPLAFFLPRIGPIWKLLVSLCCIAALLSLSYWLWVHQNIFISTFFPIFVVVMLLLFDTIYGYFIKSQQSQAIKHIFGQYVSNEYIDLMMKKKKEFGLYGESKELAILFSDIRNFTSITEKMNATQIKTFLNDYLSEMTQLIFDTKGTIDKYIGDAVMAFWGAPLEDPQMSLHAVMTAFAMNKKLKELNEKLPESAPSIKIGIGIATGVVYVGDMGSKFHRSYSAVGDDVNLASRLGDLTKRYSVGIIVSGSTEAATRDHFFYRRLDRVQVKGKKLVIPIFEPICPIEEVTPALKNEVERHMEALDAYSIGDFEKAKAIWENLKNTQENKNLYSMYLERCDKEKPSGSDWNGVQIFEVK